MIEIAKNYASLSQCKKRKVGCVVIKDKTIIAYGYNHGIDEKCFCSMSDKNPHVLHAEKMALCGKDREIYEGASIFVTYPPCCDCMTLIKQCKLKEVIYLDKSGVEQHEQVK